jgi:hypothetical protein
MRLSPWIGCLFLILPSITSSAFGAGPDVLEIERIHARRSLEVAKLELQLYLQVDYPRELRYLDSAITLTQAEIDACERRLRQFEPLTRFSIDNPFPYTWEQQRLGLLEAELRLKDLKAERFALVRFHADKWRLLELKVQEARYLLIALEHTEPIADPSI